jgi:hypothetical protein
MQGGARWGAYRFRHPPVVEWLHLQVRNRPGAHPRDVFGQSAACAHPAPTATGTVIGARRRTSGQQNGREVCLAARLAGASRSSQVVG